MTQKTPAEKWREDWAKEHPGLPALPDPQYVYQQRGKILYDRGTLQSVALAFYRAGQEEALAQVEPDPHSIAERRPPEVQTAWQAGIQTAELLWSSGDYLTEGETLDSDAIPEDLRGEPTLIRDVLYGPWRQAV